MGLSRVKKERFQNKTLRFAFSGSDSLYYHNLISHQPPDQCILHKVHTLFMFSPIVLAHVSMGLRKKQMRQKNLLSFEIEDEK